MKERQIRPLVACNQCQGSGQHELSPRIWDTYRRLPTDWTSTIEVRMLHESRLAPTALIGRLNTLVDYGLVERRPNETERGLEWRRKP